MFQFKRLSLFVDNQIKRKWAIFAKSLNLAASELQRDGMSAWRKCNRVAVVSDMGLALKQLPCQFDLPSRLHIEHDMNLQNCIVACSVAPGRFIADRLYLHQSPLKLCV